MPYASSFRSRLTSADVVASSHFYLMVVILSASSTTMGPTQRLGFPGLRQVPGVTIPYKRVKQKEQTPLSLQLCVSSTVIINDHLSYTVVQTVWRTIAWSPTPFHHWGQSDGILTVFLLLLFATQECRDRSGDFHFVSFTRATVHVCITEWQRWMGKCYIGYSLTHQTHGAQRKLALESNLT